MPDEIADLLERVRTATGPDRELDRDIWNYFHPNANPGPTLSEGHFTVTASLDAALALVELVKPEFAVQVDRFTNGMGGALLWNDTQSFKQSRAASPALALLAALLASMKETSHE